MRLEDASLFRCDLKTKHTFLIGHDTPEGEVDMLLLSPDGVVQIWHAGEDETERFAVPEPCTPEMLLSWL